MRKITLSILLIVAFIMIGCEKTAFINIPSEHKIINDFYTDKARYMPKDNVRFSIGLTNNSGKEVSGKTVVIIKYLGDEIDRLNSEVIKLKLGESIKIDLNWTAKQDDYKGYSAECWFVSGNNAIDMRGTAVDISSDWSRFPRYGYLADFGQLTEAEIRQKVAFLNKYHINGLQFYDWQYKHQSPLSGSVENIDSKWKDIANRDIYKSTVDSYIAAAHKYNMMAMNYNLMFGAYDGYEEDGISKEWGLFKDAKGIDQDYHPLPSVWATDRLFLMNPANKEWQKYIFSKEKDVFKAFEFDGWHVDQLGDRGSRYDFLGNKVNLPLAYVDFLNNAKDYLNKKLVFNAVSEFGQVLIAPLAKVDFLYVEVWDNQSRYIDLQNIINKGYQFSKSTKTTVLAGYMNYRKANARGEFNAPGVLLADAVIFASGGSHLELGDTGMLCKEYFPNDNLKMSEDLKKDLLEYYDFAVAYQNLLRDSVDKVDGKIVIDGVKLSKNAQSKSLWYFIKGKGSMEILHLINLLESDNYWRDDFGYKKEPVVQENLKVKYYSKDKINRVRIASPDFNEGVMVSLDFVKGHDSLGDYITITIPKLKYWDMLIIDK